MDILFISMIAFENNASATIRNKSLIKGLSELGHSVDTLTLSPDEVSISYDKSMNDIEQLVRNFYYIDINPLYRKLMAKKVISNKSSKNNRNILKFLLGRSRSYIKKIFDKTTIFDAQKFNVKGVSKVKIDYDKYDVIISSSDPKSSHLIAKKIYKENKNCHSKWIQYWGDPMYNDITREDDWRNMIFKIQEYKLLKKADKVVYVSPLTLKLQKSTYPGCSKKMSYASQAYIDNYIAKDIEMTNKIQIAYFGAYISKIRNIMPLYNAAKTNKFLLNIGGASDIELEETDNIKIEGKLSYEDVRKKETQSDVLVCICNLKGTQIPGKIYYSAGYNKPIIIILDGEYKNELKRHFESFNRYILCDNNEESIIKAINKAKKQINNVDLNGIKGLESRYIAKKILEA